MATAIQLHRQEHAREVLMSACREAICASQQRFAIATGSVESVVERFIIPSQVA